MIRINLIAEEKTISTGGAGGGGESAGAAMIGGASQSELILAGIMIVVVLVLGARFMQLNGQLTEKQDQRADLEQQKRDLQPFIDKVDILNRRRDSLTQKIQVINELKTNQAGPVRALDALSRELPDLVWLENVKLTGLSVSLRGKAMNENAVASYISNLDESSLFNEPENVSMSAAKAGGEDVFNFSLSCTFVPPAPSAEPAAG